MLLHVRRSRDGFPECENVDASSTSGRGPEPRPAEVIAGMERRTVEGFDSDDSDGRESAGSSRSMEVT